MNYQNDFDGLLCMSIALQVILTLLGSFRKRCSGIQWFTFFVWSTYLLASLVATTALGKITSQSGSDSINAYWSALLLTHLGGPDSITALALVDNELFLRNLFHLVYLAGLAAYVIVKQLASGGESVLIVLLQIYSVIAFFSAISRCGERMWALHRANIANLRDSMLPPPNPGPCLEIIKDDHDDHHNNVADAHDHTNSMPMLPLDHVDSTDHAHSIPMPRPVAPVEQLDSDQKILLQGYHYFCNFKCLFVDLVVPHSHRIDSQRFFLQCPCKHAFQLIDVELNFMYDTLFTKAPLLHTNPFVFLRSSRVSAYVFLFIGYKFSPGRKQLYNSAIVAAFVWGFFQEIYESFQMYFSVWNVIFLKENYPNLLHSTTTEATIWWYNNSMAQYNLLSLCFKDEPTMFERILPWGWAKPIREWCENFQNTTCMDVISNDIKDFIYKQFKEMVQTSKEEIRSAEFHNPRGKWVMRMNNCLEELSWSVDVEFYKSILIWHVATDFCYSCDDLRSNETFLHGEVSKALSNYLLYLLVTFPFMLNSNIGKESFQDTCVAIKKLLIDVPKEQDKRPLILQVFSFIILQRKNSSPLLDERQKTFIMRLARSNVMRLARSNDQAVIAETEESKSVLLEAHRLARLLLLYAREERWKIISGVWVEMLSYAARNCSGKHHAERLCNGGEFLTKIWLLMAHLGMEE